MAAPKQHSQPEVKIPAPLAVKTPASKTGYAFRSMVKGEYLVFSRTRSITPLDAEWGTSSQASVFDSVPEALHALMDYASDQMVTLASLKLVKVTITFRSQIDATDL